MFASHIYASPTTRLTPRQKRKSYGGINECHLTAEVPAVVGEGEIPRFPENFRTQLSSEWSHQLWREGDGVQDGGRETGRIRMRVLWRRFRPVTALTMRWIKGDSSLVCEQAVSWEAKRKSMAVNSNFFKEISAKVLLECCIAI